MAQIDGTDGDDILIGTADDDVISALGGNDDLNGGAGNDDLRPGAGTDVVNGAAGNDVVVVTEIDGSSPDTISGGRGKDTLDLSTLLDDEFLLPIVMYDGFTQTFSIRNFFEASSSATFDRFEIFIGSSLDDQFDFNYVQTPLTISAGDGDDYITGGLNDDRIIGGEGADDLFGGNNGHDILIGGAGDDVLNLNSPGTMNGGAGFDTGIFSGSVSLTRQSGFTNFGDRIVVKNIENMDVAFFTEGKVASGDEGRNTIDATSSSVAVKLIGRGGNDTLVGAAYGDVLIGGDGNDILKGAGGSDALSGGAGKDVFVISHADSEDASIRDRITDFRQQDHDRIDLRNIDAKSSTGTTDGFSFIGSKGFDGQEGELRYNKGNGITLISADLDGDRVADFSLRLDGEIDLRAGDFIGLIRGGSSSSEDLMAFAWTGSHVQPTAVPDIGAIV